MRTLNPRNLNSRQIEFHTFPDTMSSQCAVQNGVTRVRQNKRGECGERHRNIFWKGECVRRPEVELVYDLIHSSHDKLQNISLTLVPDRGRLRAPLRCGTDLLYSRTSNWSLLVHVARAGNVRFVHFCTSWVWMELSRGEGGSQTWEPSPNERAHYHNATPAITDNLFWRIIFWRSSRKRRWK